MYGRRRDSQAYARVGERASKLDGEQCRAANVAAGVERADVGREGVGRAGMVRAGNGRMGRVSGVRYKLKIK